MNYGDNITVEPAKRGGQPTIRGMRIAVSDVLGWLAAGMSHEEIISDYPELTEEDLRAVLHMLPIVTTDNQPRSGEMFIARADHYANADSARCGHTSR